MISSGSTVPARARNSRTKIGRPDAKIAKMKGGSTHLAYKPEHAVDLDTGVIVAAPSTAPTKATRRRSAPRWKRRKRTFPRWASLRRRKTPSTSWPIKGYHSRDVLKDLDDSPWKTRIAEPRPSKGYLRWHGDDEARAAVYANRNRLGARSGFREPD